MRILLCYSYHPNTTATYFERALGKRHEVHYVGAASGSRAGYPSNQDLVELIAKGFPQPDLVLLVDSGGCACPRGMERMSCPTAVYLIDVHRHLRPREVLAPLFDYVFVAQKDYTDYFRRLGNPQVYWLPLACDMELHGGRSRPKVWDVGFVGQIHSPARARRLGKLAERYRLNDYQRIYPREEIAEIYSQSRIVFNSSIDGDLNMRVFEAMASGSLLVTDHIENGQADLFQDRVHLVEYVDDKDLLSQVEYYLQHDEEREQIARAGYERVMEQHTYTHRCQSILDTIFGDGTPNLMARARHMDEAGVRSAYTQVYKTYVMVEASLEELRMARQARKGVALTLGATLLVLAKKLYRILRFPSVA
jgi:hypothetical protein